MGLWNLDPDPRGGLARLQTPLVDAYRQFVSSGITEVGRLQEREAPALRRGAI
jgi:beta-glucosidase